MNVQVKSPDTELKLSSEQIAQMREILSNLTVSFAGEKPRKVFELDDEIKKFYADKNNPSDDDNILAQIKKLTNRVARIEKVLFGECHAQK